MLQIDLKDRISVQEVQKSAYISRYTSFCDEKTGRKYEPLNKAQVRALMQKRLRSDKTTLDEVVNPNKVDPELD